MDSMIERVKKALAETHIDFYEEPLAMNATRDDIDRLARAAIEAMREPTEEIVRAMRGRALMADCKTDQGARDIYSNIAHAALS